jgi:ABC-2 type transport system permease protein
VTRTFLFLTLCSIRNRLIRRLRRLREPRYIAGLVAGLVYLYWAILRNQLRAARRGGFFLFDRGESGTIQVVIVVAAVFLWLVTLVAWFWPSGEPPIKFTAAEVQFFYPAPLRRRQILHYKLLRSQIGVVVGVLAAAIFSGAATAAFAGRWTFLVGGLITFSVLRLHLVGIALARRGLRGQAGVPGRAWVPPAIMAVLSGLILGPVVVHAREWWGLGPVDAASRLLELARSQPAATGLWPFIAVIAPALASPGRAFLLAAGPALALLGLSYWWVLQSDAVLEEAAVASEKQQVRSGRRLPAPVAREAPFRLAPHGLPEFALLWKNLILLGRYASPRMVLRMLLPIVVLSLVLGTRGGAALPSIALVFAGFFTLLGPYTMRNDLRHDMPRLAILKSWPVSGHSIVVGEMLAPWVVLSVLAWTSLAVALAASGGLHWSWASAADRAVLAVACALTAPALIGTQLLIQNSAVVLFPGWIPTGGTRARGIEGMGQQMLMLAGTLFALLVGVLPAAAVAGLVGAVLYALVGVPGLLPAGVVFVGVLAAEAVLLVVFLGHLLERTEPAQVEGEA